MPKPTVRLEQPATAFPSEAEWNATGEESLQGWLEAEREFFLEPGNAVFALEPSLRAALEAAADRVIGDFKAVYLLVLERARDEVLAEQLLDADSVTKH